MSRPTAAQLLAAHRELSKAERAYQRERVRFDDAQEKRLTAIRAAAAAGMTLEQLGMFFGVTRQRVHQMLH